MLSLLWSFARLDFRDRYPGRLAVVGELVAVALGLLVYWYTARAFAPAFASELGASGTDYFSYIVIGELALLVPLQMIDGLATSVRQAMTLGTLDAMLSLPVNPQTPALFLGTSGLPRDLLRVAATFALAAVFFGLRVKASGVGAVLLLQLVALPAFLGLAMCASAAFVVFGRGFALLTHFATVAALVAGAYFPVSVLPEPLRQGGALLSPFNALLEASRGALAWGWSDPRLFGWYAKLVVAGLVFFPLGYYLLGLGFRHVRRRGAPLIA